LFLCGVHVQLVAEVREIVRELREHANLVRQWATLMTPGHADAASYDDTEQKQLLSAVSDLCSALADRFMDNLSSYHADRSRKAFDVRESAPTIGRVSYIRIYLCYFCFR